MTKRSVLAHITTTSGHVRLSPRSEVSGTVLAALAPVIASARGTRTELPPCPGYYLTVGPILSATAILIEGPGGVLVRCAVAATPKAARDAAEWLKWEPPADAPELPWLLVEMQPALIDDVPATEWLGDCERCVAWVLLDGQDGDG